jgi:hypothetical protein
MVNIASWMVVTVEKGGFLRCWQLGFDLKEMAEARRWC